jgi:hypothetical protein
MRVRVSVPKREPIKHKKTKEQFVAALGRIII